MIAKRSFTDKEAREIGDALGIDWAMVDVGEFRRGLEVELEHGAHDPQTNVTDDDPLMTGRIAWAHLKEIRDYYTRLDKLEAEAAAYWKSRATWVLGDRETARASTPKGPSRTPGPHDSG